MTINHVAVDIDGTIAGSHEAVIDKLNNVYREELLKEGTIFSIFSIDDYDEWGEKFEKFGITTEDCIDILLDIWKNDYSNIELIDDKDTVTNSLEKLNFKFKTDIVTGNPYPDKVNRWLKDNGIYECIHYDHLISIGGLDCEKSDLGYDVYIDDNPYLINELDTHQSLLLYHRPYNFSVEDGFGPLVFTIDNIQYAAENLYRWNEKLEDVEEDNW